MSDNTCFATPEDLEDLWRDLSNQEYRRADSLLPLISNTLRFEAKKVGKDLDQMIEEGILSSDVAKAVTVDICIRILRQDTSGEAMSQESQSALGYTWSGTYAVPGGGIANAILRNDLKRLGLRRQKMGVIDLCGSREPP